jgi:hypothetical protein
MKFSCRYIASIPSAVDILHVAGFSHNVANKSNNDPAGDVLSLNRKDPGLLYMVQNVLQGVVEAVDEMTGL